MSSEIAVRSTELPTAADMNAAMVYAERLANSGLLPKQYFKQPANLLYAIEYGRMIGLAPMAAVTGVHVIEGKPTASAALISALVRRAGHKLRVKGDAKSATAQIVRSDDPDYVFSVTFTLDDARAANLTNKAVWKQYPASMLKARAITQCARDACEEALLGMHYTPEELGAEVDEDGEPMAVQEPQFTPQDVAEAVVRKAQAERQEQRGGDANPFDPGFDLPASVGRQATDAQVQTIAILCKEKRGISGKSYEARVARMEVIASVIGRRIASSKELTVPEASQVIEALKSEPDHVEDAEIVEEPDAAQAEAVQLAASDAPPVEAAVDDLRDALESAGSVEQLTTEWGRVEAAQEAGVVDGVAVGMLRQVASRREDALKADSGWSRGISRQMDAAA